MLSRKERLILELLVQHGEMYGMEMVKASPELKRGTIYVTLSRMAEKGYLQSRQLKDPDDPGLPRRLFRVTPYGHQVLAAWDAARATLARGRLRQPLPHTAAGAASLRGVTPARKPGKTRDPRSLQVNDLVDRFESGTMTRLEFIRTAAGLGVLAAGLGSFIEPREARGEPSSGFALVPSDLARTGFCIRVTRIAPTAGNAVEGMVLPEALPFRHRLSAGSWQHLTTAGEGTIEVETTSQAVPAGTGLAIPSGQWFSYLNPGLVPWEFRASLPFWQPPSFSYSYQDVEYSGDEIWFEIKRSPTELTTRPVYRIIPASPRMNYAIATVAPGEQTINAESTTGAIVITVISGEIVLTAGNGTSWGTAALERGQALTVPQGKIFNVANKQLVPAMFEMRPDPPRIWTPEAMLWEIDPGRMSTGDLVWFEIVIPIG